MILRNMMESLRRIEERLDALCGAGQEARLPEPVGEDGMGAFAQARSPQTLKEDEWMQKGIDSILSYQVGKRDGGEMRDKRYEI